MVKGLCPACEQFHRPGEPCDADETWHRCPRCGEWIGAGDEPANDGCRDPDCPEDGNG